MLRQENYKIIRKCVADLYICKHCVFVDTVKHALLTSFNFYIVIATGGADNKDYFIVFPMYLTSDCVAGAGKAVYIRLIWGE